MTFKNFLRYGNSWGYLEYNS